MNEGFKALPEYVQRKIDPEAAEKFMGGGSVMQRPLFRQMGGPAAPPMMGMAPPQVNPEQVAQVQNMEDRAMGQGEQLGQAYASEMITNIDAADDAKSLIDAFRGNEKPLEARYAELAGYVGEADANRTPESVLTMVQPTIMMTEEGAVDSGIGELMQSLVQDVGMAEGEQMSQGVGELMAMGAGNTPPVNFNQGGPVMVRKFQTGTPPGGPKAQEPVALGTSLMPYYEEAQKIRSEILGTPEERAAQLQEQKNLTQAQMLFDIAQAGLQFAGTTEGRSIAERLANAAAQSQLFPTIGARAAQFQEVKDAQKRDQRAMDLSALESAERQVEAQRAREGTMALEGLKQAGALTQLAQQFEYQQKRDETQFGYSTRLASHKSDLTAGIEKLKLDAAAARNSENVALQERLAAQQADLQRQLNETNNALKLEMQAIDIDAAKLAREDDQAFQLELQEKKESLQILLQATELTNDKELIEARTKAQKELTKLQTIEDLKKFEAQFEITSAFELEKMEAGAEKDKELLDHKANIEMLAQNRAQAFTASQNALNRLAEKTNIATRAELTAELQKELQAMSQEFQGDENAKQRAATLAQNMIQNAFTEDEILLRTAQLKLDQTYKLGSLALEEAAQNAVALGSKSDTAIIKYITDADRLNAYANGDLGDNKTQFEQAVLNYLTSAPEVWDREQGIYVKGPSPKLAPRVLEALKKGDPAFYNQVVSGSDAAKPVSQAETIDTQAVAEAINNVGETANLTQIADVIMKDGKVQKDSPIWLETELTRYKPNIDYTKAIGASRIGPGLKKTFQEGFEEFNIGQGADAESQNLAQAQSDLRALSNDLLLMNTQIADDRVLKFVQEKIAEETNKLEPGGIFFKTDADARATLQTLADTLALGIEKKAVMVPEFGGSAVGYKTEQVTKARAAIQSMIPMLNEVLAFQRGFNKGRISVNTRGITESGTLGALEFLEQNRVQTEVPEDG